MVINMKKKAGIITIEGNKNYGNKLQNYALQQILENKGYEVYTIWQKKSIIKKLKLTLKKIYSILFNSSSKKRKDYKRERVFKEFSNNYLNIKYIKRKKISNLDKNFDCYIIGSDQIWNPDIIKTYLGLEILNNKKKKISYAASIAQKNINSNFKELIKKNITIGKIKYVSLREETGKKTIENLTKRTDIKCVLDPTLLLKRDEWEKLIVKPNYLSDKKFILCYFLGILSPKKQKQISEYAQNNNCTVINLLDSNKIEYYSSVGEFLYLEKNAYAIFTDSFHSSVFGLIFGTPFYVFERDDKINDMSSRLLDFLKLFNLEEQLINEKNFSNINNITNYKNSYKILDKERKKSLNFLDMALTDNEK